MANIKSQIKRNRQNEKRRVRNRVFRGEARTAVKDARHSIEAGDVKESRAAVLRAISALDTAVQRGVIHRNNAARRKSRLMKYLAGIKPQEGKAKVEPKEEAEAVAEPAPKKAGARKAAKLAARSEKKAAAKAEKKPAAKAGKKPVEKAAKKKTAAKKPASKK